MDSGVFKNYSGNPTKFVVILVLSIVAGYLTVYCLSNNIQIVFTHFFYIPILIAAYWFRRWGVVYAVFLTAFYLCCISFLSSPDMETLLAALARGAVFIGMSAAIAVLSSMLLQQQHEIENSERKFRGIWEHIHAGIVLIDAETHTVLAANPETEAMTGYSEQEMIGHTCHLFICPTSEGTCPIRDEGSEDDNSERVLLAKSGRQIPVLKTVTVVEVDRKKYYIESFVDISARRDAENALIAYIREATLRIRNPVELVRDNLGEIREQVMKGNVPPEHIGLTIAIQQKNMEEISNNLSELEHAIAEKRREIPDALRDYLMR